MSAAQTKYKNNATGNKINRLTRMGIQMRG